jgi:hypothetical protein
MGYIWPKRRYASFRDFPHFIQRAEQIKIEYFCTVCPVKALNESILGRLTRLEEQLPYRRLNNPCHIAADRAMRVHRTLTLLLQGGYDAKQENLNRHMKRF